MYQPPATTERSLFDSCSCRHVTLAQLRPLIDSSMLTVLRPPYVVSCDWQELWKMCPKLQALDLTGCTNIACKGLVALASSCPHLLRLTLSQSCAGGDAGLQAIGGGCPQLQELNVCGCHTKRYFLSSIPTKLQIFFILKIA